VTWEAVRGCTLPAHCTVTVNRDRTSPVLSTATVSRPSRDIASKVGTDAAVMRPGATLCTQRTESASTTKVTTVF
jgi:hypothetical protein